MQSDENQPFWRNILLSFSWLKSKPRKRQNEAGSKQNKQCLERSGTTQAASELAS
jgi:hypothetical protein